MAAVLDKNEAAAKFGSQVDEQIAQATNRIRVHDLAFGGLVIVVLVLIYATAMISLDKYLNLAEWVRQLALAGFLGVLAGATYLTIFSPLRKRINPLYAAKQVERTIEDAKNSVTGYVDAQQKADLSPTVKAALASRAAKSAAEADLSRAVDHRSLIYLGGLVVTFLLALVVLFFVFRPAQFTSLAGRAFAPFSKDPISSQTQLTLVKPDPADPTITLGQSITVAVYVEGKVPRPDGPEKVRLLVRHNLADQNYEEIPMVPAQGGTSREWELRVPDYLVQNGFWYKVAAGDDATAEHRVTIRSLPTFTEFSTSYEYPAYLRRQPERGVRDPVIRTYRGTTVTLVTKTNREARDGTMTIEPGNTTIAGTPVPGKPDSLQFQFKIQAWYRLTDAALAALRDAKVPEPVLLKLNDLKNKDLVGADALREIAKALTADETKQFVDAILARTKLPDPAKYKLTFTATNGERCADPFQSLIIVDADQPPRLDIVKPDEEQPLEIPANGQLAVDGKVGDDFGIDTVTLKMKLVEPVERQLPDVPYLNDKSPSFRRADETFPTSLDYKVSVDLAKLNLAERAVIEYWLEATDNCTEPKANVGRSVAKRVQLTPPKTEEMDQQNLEKQKDARKTEEQKHQDQQKKKLEKEKRDPNKKDGQKGKNGQPQDGGEGTQGGDPKDGNKKNEANAQNPPNEPPQPNPDNNSGMGGTGNPTDKPMGSDDQPKQPDPNNEKQNDGTDPKGGGANDKSGAKPDSKIDDTAKKLADELKRENESSGGGKSNPAAEERTPPAQPKQQPPKGDTGTPDGASAPKPEKSDPMSKGANDPADGKNEGGIQQLRDPATPKPPQPDNANPMNQQKGAAPSEGRVPPPPVGGAPGNDKQSQQPPAQQPKQPANPDPKQDPTQQPKQPTDANPKQDPNSGSAAKGATEQPDEPGKPNTDKKDPAAAAASKSKPPVQEVTRGGEKAPPPQQNPMQSNEDGAKQGEPEAGSGKAQEPPPSGSPKGAPKDGAGKGMDSEPKGGDEGANQPKSPNGTGAAEIKKDDTKKPTGDGSADKPVEKGSEKQPPPRGADKGNSSSGGGAAQNNDPDKGNPGAGGDNAPARKPTEKEMKELQQAANDLAGSDDKKKGQARNTLDKAIGKDKREELEKTANDLKSPDKATREAAQQKIEQMKKDIAQKDTKDGSKGGTAPEPDEQQKKDLEDAVNNLKSTDEAKKRDAQQKVDRAIGEENRKELEQAMEDLKSTDKAKQEAGRKKLENLKNKLEGKPNDPKGKQPTPEEINDLVKQAQDLNSMDEAKRKQAEKTLDEKIGEDNRKKLQEEMAKPKTPKDIEEMKKQLKEWREGLGDSPPPKGGTEDDKRNRLKAAELQLERFEDEKNRQLLKDKMGWTEEQYKKFLADYADYIGKMRKDIEKPDAPPSGDKPDKKFNPGGLNEGVAPGASSGPAGVGGPTVAPPGFEDARRKFEEALKKAKP